MQQRLAAVSRRESVPNVLLAEEDMAANGEVFVVYGWLMAI
jgi:hypothetical protein